VLGVSYENGLSDVLEQKINLSQAILHNVADLGFDFVGCGSRSEHPAEILGSAAMKKFMDQAKKEYDIVLLDSPPYLAVADVTVLSEYVEGVVVVARYHKTDKSHLKGIQNRFAHPGIKMLGVVINEVSVREKDYYYHQYYYYGYGDLQEK
jgi:tyrosine-protein kinase Etk/Wzc